MQLKDDDTNTRVLCDKNVNNTMNPFRPLPAHSKKQNAV